MALIYRAECLCKSYGGQTAFAISDFSLEKGDCLVLTGPNGSGKSTFLRLLAFLERPDCGELEYFGPGEPRRGCTLLLQEPWLLRMNVFKNVTLGLKLRRDNAHLRDRFEAAMRACGFTQPEEFAARRPGSLSGGEKQRIALAARLILRPSVLLLDEPTAYVDARSADCILQALLLARQEGATIVCATHDSKLGESIAGRVMRLERACRQE